MIKILISADHDILRAGVKYFLSGSKDISIDGESKNGMETITTLHQKNSDVLLLDMTLTDYDVIQLIQKIKKAFRHLPILLLGMHEDESYLVRAMKAGASGYLCTDNAREQLAPAIRKVSSGELFITQNVAEKIALHHLQGDVAELPHHRLTDREYQVFQLILRGLSVTEIGKKLDLSVKTASTHKTSLTKKMGLTNTVGLIRYAIQHKLI